MAFSPTRTPRWRRNFVKLRQHGGTTRQQVKTNIYELSWQPGTIPQIEVKPLYEQEGFPEKVWVERWQPGTALSNVVESEVKEILVIEGIWSDELGDYPRGSWLRYSPNSPYSPSSATGCLVYVKTYPLDSTRFIVGKDFRQPFDTTEFSS
ncbi:MAG: cupin domain-containing protein [Microcoleus sp.]